MNINSSLCLSALFLAAGGLLSGCGGGSSGGDNDTATISGVIYAAPVSGAQVSIKTAGGEVVAGPVRSGSDGNYTIEVDEARLSEALIVESSGGSFEDEATGLQVTEAGRMAAYLAAGELSSGANTVSLTPGTTIVETLITTHRKTLQQAEDIFRNAFGFTPDRSVRPRMGDGDEHQLRAGLRAAVFSRLNMDLGLLAARQFELLAGLAEDLADGTLDGSTDGNPITVGNVTLSADLPNRFARAYIAFFMANETGLLADRIDPLPDSTVAITENYRIERTPMMGPMMGKSTCTLTITNNSDGTPATGLNLSLTPVMHMAMHSHSTPVDGCVEQADSLGTYRCTVYYLMASKMMNGTSMGFWEMKVTIGDEEAHFYPSVMMAMGGDTPLVKLKGQSDLIAPMGTMGSGDDMHGGHTMMAAMDMGGDTGGAEKRTYFLFHDGLTGTTGNHTFDLFIATKESMMSYPAVSVGTTLKDETGTEWAVNTMSVELSTDQTNWIAATDNGNGNGHWSTGGISGLTDGTQGTLYVRLIINGEQKTDDGNAPDGIADYAEFKVTPGGSSMSMEM